MFVTTSSVQKNSNCVDIRKVVGQRELRRLANRRQTHVDIPAVRECLIPRTVLVLGPEAEVADPQADLTGIDPALVLDVGAGEPVLVAHVGGQDLVVADVDRLDLAVDDVRAEDRVSGVCRASGDDEEQGQQTGPLAAYERGEPGSKDGRMGSPSVSGRPTLPPQGNQCKERSAPDWREHLTRTP